MSYISEIRILLLQPPYAFLKNHHSLRIVRNISRIITPTSIKIVSRVDMEVTCIQILSFIQSINPLGNSKDVRYLLRAWYFSMPVLVYWDKWSYGKSFPTDSKGTLLSSRDKNSALVWCTPLFSEGNNFCSNNIHSFLNKIFGRLKIHLYS